MCPRKQLNCMYNMQEMKRHTAEIGSCGRLLVLEVLQCGCHQIGLDGYNTDRLDD